MNNYDHYECYTTLNMGLKVVDAFQNAPSLKRALGTKKSQEEQQMFGKHKITSVVIGEINPVTLELAVKKMAAANSKIQLVEKQEKTYIVTEGADPIELSGEAFKDLIKGALVGKTLDEVRGSSALNSLLTNLNIIEEVILEKPQTKLSDIFK